MSSARQRHRNVSLLAGQNLGAVEVAAIRNGIERASTKNVLLLRCDLGKLGAVRAGIRHLVGDDQMISVSTATCTL